MASIGYASVSTVDQNAQMQMDALKKTGCERMFTDHGVSRIRASRPELDRMLDHWRPGQTRWWYGSWTSWDTTPETSWHSSMTWSPGPSISGP